MGKHNLTNVYKKLALYTLIISALLRVILLFNPQTINFHPGIFQYFKIFFLGAINDLAVLTVGFVFIWLYSLLLTDWKYKKVPGYIIFTILAAAFLYVVFFNTIFDEYGSKAPLVAKIILGFWAHSFGLRFFSKRIRKPWVRVEFGILLFLYIGVISFNAVSEYIFWNEFGVRYNFIAVDYLVYTHEVIGNIMESYPVIPVFAALALITAVLTWLLFRKNIEEGPYYASFSDKIYRSIAYVALFFISLFFLPQSDKLQKTDDVYYNELQSNGVYEFCRAFMSNDLQYSTFYKTLPEQQAWNIVHEEYGSTGRNKHQVNSSAVSQGEMQQYLSSQSSTQGEIHRNIVLVTLESLSASFMERYGNEDHLTPYLDSLANKSLSLDCFFANGNRTVRGLEAVTLCLPPCPGMSIIKQKNNGNKHSTAEILAKKGYDVMYFYGGDSYFDNMKTFFSGNGYDIIDKSDFDPKKVTFQNIWGVCDEDLYSKVIDTLNVKAASNKPFFAHVMSVSNHRPYTYPGGRISIPEDSKSRAGGVMYSDYAIGKFIEQASREPWFKNTIFIITADHCASSSGKTAIPLEKYHIPAMIYAPGFVKPGVVNKIASQIDLMPTVFALLNFNYESWFYGQNILSPDFRQRAFMATYQSLGYYEDDCLTILYPVKVAKQFDVFKDEKNNYNTEHLELESTPRLKQLLERSISMYQTSSED